MLEALDPYVHEDEEETGAAEKIIQAVLPEDDKVKRAWCKLHDGLSSLQYPARRVGFFVGVFIGAKFQGASRDDLVRIGEALTVPCVQQWDRAEATEKYQAKQKAKTAKAVPAKTLDRLASELGKTIKGMTLKQKREYARNGKGGRP